MINADSEEALLYTCPICRASVEVGQQFIGDTVTCPKCSKLIEIVAPQAHPAQPGTERGGENQARIEKPADEEVIVQTIHPVVFRRHFFGTLIATILVIAGIASLVLGLTGSTVFGFNGMWLWIPGGVLLGFGSFMLLKWLVMSRMQSLQLTSERIIYTYGIVQRDTSEMRHDDVRNIKVEQNLVERLLNFGDVAISSAGQDDMEVVIHDIPNPQGVTAFIRKRQ